MAESRILVARVGAAHGICGEVRVKPYGDDPLAFASYGPLETADGARLIVVSARPQKGVVLVRFMGADDRNAAEALNGVDLFVPRDRLPEPEDDDEFYHSDLIGLSAVTASGERVGTVVAVPNFGASDLVEVEPDSGRSFYLPFTAAFVPEIDLAAGRIVIEIPQGYLSESEALGGAGTDE